MNHTIHHVLPYPTNKPSNEDIDLHAKDFPHLREYPNGKRFRISDPKPDRVYLTIPLMDEVLAEKVAAQVPIEDRCMAVSQLITNGGANCSIVPNTNLSSGKGPYERKFQLSVGQSGALLWCEFVGGKKHGPRLLLNFNPSKLGPQGHKAIADLLFGLEWLCPATGEVYAKPAIFRRENFAQYAKLNQVDIAVDCTGIRPSELLMRHLVVDASALYCSANGLETIYLRNASQPDKRALVKAYDKTAEAIQNGCDVSAWPSQITRVEVTRKGLKNTHLKDIFDLKDPFSRIRCGYTYAQGYPCFRKLDIFMALRRIHNLEATAERMNLTAKQSEELQTIVRKVPNPDLVRPKQTFQGWVTGCHASGIEALFPA